MTEQDSAAAAQQKEPEKMVSIHHVEQQQQQGRSKIIRETDGIQEVITNRGIFRVGDWVNVSVSFSEKLNQYPHKILKLAKDRRYDPGFKARLGGNPDCPHCRRQERRKSLEPFYTLDALTILPPSQLTEQEEV